MARAILPGVDLRAIAFRVDFRSKIGGADEKTVGTGVRAVILATAPWFELPMAWRLLPALLLAPVVVLGCGGTRAERCENARVVARVFSNQRTALDRYTARLDDLDMADRCAEIADEERAEAASRAAIREHPESPRLGATPRETWDVCARNHGVDLLGQSTAISVCVQPGADPDDFLFAAHFKDMRVDSVTVSFEGMSSNDVLDRIRESDAVNVVERVARSGYRSWEWREDDMRIVVEGYPRGARLSFILD